MNVRTLQATKELWEAHNSIADSVLVILSWNKNMVIKGTKNRFNQEMKQNFESLAKHITYS